jgi:hypothetical protein
VVSVAPSHSTAAELHDRAHRIAFAARDENYWWNGSLETALAAAAGALHTTGNRHMGERALDALLQWYADGHPRPIGEDAAALALAAFAAKQLRGGSKELTDAALDTLRAVLATSRAEIAPLHLTLAAWGLERVRRADEDSPWPELRDRLRSSSTTGINGPLIAYGLALSSPGPDPRELAHALVAAPSVVASEQPILLWVLWSASVMLSDVLPDDDADLEVIRRRRAEMFESVASELEFGDFDPVSEEEFDPFDGSDAPTRAADVFEMLMIDFALSPEITGQPFQTPTEGRAMARRARREALLLAAGAIEAAAVLGCGLSITIGLLSHARPQIITGVAAMSLAGGSILALRAWDAAGPTRWPRGRLLIAELTLLLFGAAIIINWWNRQPRLRGELFWPAAIGLAASFWLAALYGAVRVVLGFRRSEDS